MAEQQTNTNATNGASQQARQGSQESSQGAAPAAGGADQERQRPVSREGADTSRDAVGVQRRAGGRPLGAGTALAARGQPSLLPAFMASPGLMASAFLSNPYAFAQAMSQEMDRVFASFGDEGWAPNAQPELGRQAGRGVSAAPRGGRASTQWVPQLEVRQRGDDLVVCADLPGLSPDDVQVDVEDGVLTISGERRQASESDEEGFYRSERSYGAFSRSIPLPDGVDEDRVNARFEHGVLEVTVPLPQQQRQRGRRVEIQSGAARSSAQQSSPAQQSQQSSQAQQSPPSKQARKEK